MTIVDAVFEYQDEFVGMTIDYFGNLVLLCYEQSKCDKCLINFYHKINKKKINLTYTCLFNQMRFK